MSCVADGSTANRFEESFLCRDCASIRLGRKNCHNFRIGPILRRSARQVKFKFLIKYIPHATRLRISNFPILLHKANPSRCRPMCPTLASSLPIPHSGSWCETKSWTRTLDDWGCQSRFQVCLWNLQQVGVKPPHLSSGLEILRELRSGYQLSSMALSHPAQRLDRSLAQESAGTPLSRIGRNGC
jgi:hypothetical protein